MLSRRAFIQVSLAGMGLVLEGCGTSSAHEASAGSPQGGQAAQPEEAPEEGIESPSDDPSTEESRVMSINVIVNGIVFTAHLDEGPAGQALRERLPLTLTMDELHGNEKYCYTGEDFGGTPTVPDVIACGDLMVFGPDCLVLFYETFANDGWSYTHVGRLDDPSGLAEACGSGAATVTFEAVT